MSIQAFGARRVSRSLREIATYLDEGIKVAGGIPPGQTVKLDLDPAPVALTPRITDVVWGNGEHVLHLPQTDPVTVKVIGDDLNDTKKLELVFSGIGPTFSTTTVQTESSGRLVQAQIQINSAGPPKPGSYHALVTDGQGQRVILEGACSIEAAATPQPQPQPGLQLSAVIPNHGIEGRSFCALLLVLRGDPTRFRLTDLNNNPQGWTVEQVSEATCREHYAMSNEEFRAYVATSQRLHKSVKVVFLRISLVQSQEAKGTSNAKKPPSKQHPRIFCLVAESDVPKSEDMLAFEVDQQPQSAEQV